MQLDDDPFDSDSEGGTDGLAGLLARKRHAGPRSGLNPAAVELDSGSESESSDMVALLDSPVPQSTPPTTSQNSSRECLVPSIGAGGHSQPKLVGADGRFGCDELDDDSDSDLLLYADRITAVGVKSVPGEAAAPGNGCSREQLGADPLEQALRYVLDYHDIPRRSPPATWKESAFLTTVLPAVRDRDWVIMTLTSLLFLVEKALQTGSDCTIINRVASQTKNKRTRAGTSKLSFSTVSYSAANPRVKNVMFVRLVVVASYCLDAIVSGRVISKRDVYYKHVALFEHQASVNRMVDRLSHALDVSREVLHVTGASKGLCLGSCSIVAPDGRVTSFTQAEGSLIPYCQEDSSVDVSATEWVLITEKEASFRTLASSLPLKKQALANGAIVTGKGYPDLNTRSFLNRIAFWKFPVSVPMYALVDLDPDGLLIYLTYKYGSQSHCHRSDHLVATTLDWLGPKPADVLSLAQSDQLHAVSSLIPMTARERKKAVDVLGRPQCVDNGPEPEVRTALQVLLMLNYKAEIQGVETRSQHLGRWVSAKLASLDCPLKRI